MEEKIKKLQAYITELEDQVQELEDQLDSKTGNVANPEVKANPNPEVKANPEAEAKVTPGTNQTSTPEQLLTKALDGKVTDVTEAVKAIDLKELIIEGDAIKNLAEIIAKLRSKKPELFTNASGGNGESTKNTKPQADGAIGKSILSRIINNKKAAAEEAKTALDNYKI